MGKSLKNAVSPDEMYEAYGADTLRLYVMAIGPLDASRPWETRDVIGMYRFLQRLWRNVVDEQTGACTVVDVPADDDTRRVLHRTIDVVRTEMDALRFNTAIAKLIELNNPSPSSTPRPREVAEPLVLMVAPLAPHLAEELWRRLGHDDTVTYADVPGRRPGLPGRRHGRVPGAGERQGARPHHGRRRRRRPTRSRPPRSPTPRWPQRSTAHAEEGHRRARPHGQRRRLTRTVRPRSAQERSQPGCDRSWASADQAWSFLMCTRPRPTSTSISAEAMKAAIEAMPAIWPIVDQA